MLAVTDIPAYFKLENSTSTHTLCVFLATFVIIWLFFRKNKTFPPGPRGLPIVGSLPFLASDVRKSLAQLALKYGDVFTIYMGRQPVVVLGSYEALRDGMVRKGQAFAGRPSTYLEEAVTLGKGIASNEGAAWREQRKFLHMVLKDLGMGSKVLENRINEEVDFFEAAVKGAGQDGRPFYMYPMLKRSIANVIGSMLFGSRFEYDDPAFQKYMDFIQMIFEQAGAVGALSFLPFLKYLPGDPFKDSYLKEANRKFRGDIRKTLKERKTSPDRGKNKCFVDMFLDTIEEHEGQLETSFTIEDLVILIIELFAAGTETAATTLQWGLLFLLHNPHVQERIQAEIDDVIGRDRVPSYDDNIKLNYTMATLTEIHRLADVSPFATFHRTTRNVTVHGHKIPTGTIIMPNLNSVHHNPKYWDEPKAFRPERFIDSSGKFVKPEKVLPFSLGKRNCVGEPFSRMELFLFFTRMMQRFKFLPKEDNVLPGFEGIRGIIFMPKPFPIRAIPR